MYENLLIDRVGTGERVARITLNRPATLNALTPELMTEFAAALQALESDQTVRVIIVRGAGRAFSAGWDMTAGYAMDDKYQTRDAEGRPLTYNVALSLRWGAEIQKKFWSVSKVTIAQLHGYCLAGGLELAMMADLVTASEDCQIGHPGHRGLGVGRNGAILPLVIGMRKAKELFYTGDSVSGIQAEELGLINYAWESKDLDERTIRLADRIAIQSADLLGVQKAAANTFYENMGMFSSISTATQLDAIAQNSESRYAWREAVERDGLKGATRWRDGLYAEHGSER